jgi:hypothetical protein
MHVGIITPTPTYTPSPFDDGAGHDRFRTSSLSVEVLIKKTRLQSIINDLQKQVVILDPCGRQRDALASQMKTLQNAIFYANDLFSSPKKGFDATLPDFPR